MQRAQIVSGLAGLRPRPAGSETERRVAGWLAARLREGGREVRIEPHWVRPRWDLAYALHALLGIAASLVAVGTPLVGLCLAAAAALSLALDASGRLLLLRRLTPERATQNVCAEAPRGAGDGGVAEAPPGAGGAGVADAPRGAAADPSPTRLLLTAACDAPRGGLLRRPALRRLAGGPLLGLGPLAWLALLLVAVAACAAARLAGAGGPLLGAVQLVPSVGLLLALGLLVDSALAPPAEADASAVAVVLALAAALDERPPRALAVDVVIGGAGAVGALGLRAHLRAHRPRPERTVVLELSACGAGTPRWWTSDGALVPLRYHPRLVALCEGVAARERHLHAGPARGRESGAALRARQRGLPAIRLGAVDPRGVVPEGAGDPASIAATLELALALIDALDAELARERR